MQTYTCAACEFTFTEADKAWRDAMGTWQCPNCLKKLHDFPPGAQRTPEAELAIARPDADYGIALMAIPAVGTMLIWFWVSGMNLLQSPQDSLALIMVATIVGTGIVAAMEASKVMTELERKNGTNSPGFLFFSFLLLWFVAYPAYMFSRRTHGLPNLLAAGILLMLIFVGSSFALNSAIESKKGEIGKIFTGFQSQLKSLSEPDAEAKKALEDLQSQLASLAKQQENTQPAPTLVPAPASPSPTNISALVGKDPESALDDPALKGKFKMLLGDNLGGFKERLNVSSGITQEGEWLVGQGGMQHLFSIEEAAFAINAKTSETFAIMLTEGKNIKWFGTTDVNGSSGLSMGS